MSVSVVIPAYQAADSIGATVRAAHSVPGVTEVIVVDDGSRDGTAEAAAEAGADRVIVLPRNRGKGAALAAGSQAAARERLLFLDADLGASAVNAAGLLAVELPDPAMVVAVLPGRPGSGGFGLARGLARATIRLLAGRVMSAPLSGQRLLPASLVRHIGLAPRFAVEVGLTVEAAHLGVPIVEVPVELEHRVTGRTLSGFRHRFRQFRDVAALLVATGYGIWWPALPVWRGAVRAVAWLCLLGAVVAGAAAAASASGRAAAAAGGGGVVLWLPCLWLTAVTLGLRKPNYLGRSVPAATGLLFILVGLPALWLAAGPFEAKVAGTIVIAALGGAGLLDDLFAQRRQARGLRGHLGALLRGRVTTGAVKAFVGLAAGAAAGAALDPGRPAVIALDALLIALTANLINLLDLRPGRALKAFGLGSMAVAAVSPKGLLVLAPLLAGAVVSAPSDLSGRAMMGDVGSNALGGALGLALVLTMGPWARAAAVGVLIALHIAAERISLTEVIRRSRLLAAFDRVGAASLAAYGASGAAGEGR